MVEDLYDFSNIGLLEYIWAKRLEEENARDFRQRAEMELIRRLEGSGAKEVFHPDLTCVLETPSPVYDISRLKMLGELLDPEVLKTVRVLEHEDIITVPEKWDGRVLRTLGHKYGHEVDDVIQGAKMPGGPPRLKIGKKN